jgi:uncharacterized protein YqeY
MSGLKQTIADATKAAMKQRDKPRVGALRLINSEIKRLEVDQREGELDDDAVIDVLNRMLKQRKDSLQQFTAANRQDLADQEQFEIDVISAFMPEPLSAEDLQSLIEQAVADTEAQSMQDMGKVMGALREPLKGRADMGQVSARVKALLAG